MKKLNIIFKLTPRINQLSTKYQASSDKIYSNFLNPNVMFLLSKVNESLQIELVNALNGEILYKSEIKKVDFSKRIIPLFDQNKLFIAYNYQDKNTIRQEILSLEILHKNVESFFADFISKLINNNFEESNEIIVLSQTFAVNSLIKHMFISQTNLGVSNKNLIFVLNSNKIVLSEIRNFSSRRPILESPNSIPTDEDTLLLFYKDAELPPYTPVILFDDKRVINNNYLNETIDNVVIAPTTYESTFILCSIGHSISCYNVHPDKSFDSIPYGFLFNFILIFLAGTYIVTFMLRKHVKTVQFKTQWLNSISN